MARKLPCNRIGRVETLATGVAISITNHSTGRCAMKPRSTGYFYVLPLGFSCERGGTMKTVILDVREPDDSMADFARA